MNAVRDVGRRAAPKALLPILLVLAAMSFEAGRQSVQAADAIDAQSAGLDRHRSPGAGPIIIIYPGWPFLPGHGFRRHCPFPCVRDIRFSCGDPYNQFLPGFPAPGLPTPGAPAPGPTATLIPVPSPTPGGAASGQTYRVCPQMVARIPQSVQDVAVAEPWRVRGYGERQNPNIPFHPIWNPYRTWLTLRDPNQAYSVCNLPVWKAGCP